MRSSEHRRIETFYGCSTTQIDAFRAMVVRKGIRVYAQLHSEHRMQNHEDMKFFYGYGFMEINTFYAMAVRYVDSMLSGCPQN
jgi:hypothetical protein